MMSLTNSDDLRRLLERRTRPLVMISAHTHVPDVARQGPITYVACPPLGFWPHAYLEAAVGTASLELKLTQVLESPDESPDPRSSDPDYQARSCTAERVITIPLA